MYPIIDELDLPRWTQATVEQIEEASRLSGIPVRAEPFAPRCVSLITTTRRGFVNYAPFWRALEKARSGK